MNIVTSLAAIGPIALVLIAAMVFVENGLLFPFLPGDSLIFAAALLAPVLHVPWYVIAGIAAVGAIAGAEVGFVIGRRFGRRLFTPGARVFKTRYLDETETFFARWGRFAIVLARFVPIVRTYISPAAGASSLSHRLFSLWNALSAIVWAAVLGVAGSLLGRIPWVAANIDWIMVGVVVVTVAPVGITALKRRRRVRAAADSSAASDPAAPALQEVNR
ncbi:MAG TPA: VTT domain-containing protein [Microbacterium sp.]|uniref:DedA family protein n=1 Tax=Microbacterium sp. TaxID=51671 RepID=UPI002B46C4B0|nr:VTT domain-containing protein [Microbacterium sp.]HKT55229.1 VTT domain-containing protein [Microbacterium sp.]